MTSKLDKIFYDQKLCAALENLHTEGRYRTFIEIERARGNFPNARWIANDNTERSVTVWCGNDYLGMGQSDVVLEAMQDALSSAGAGSGPDPGSGPGPCAGSGPGPVLGLVLVLVVVVMRRVAPVKRTGLPAPKTSVRPRALSVKSNAKPRRNAVSQWTRSGSPWIQLLTTTRPHPQEAVWVSARP